MKRSIYLTISLFSFLTILFSGCASDKTDIDKSEPVEKEAIKKVPKTAESTKRFSSSPQERIDHRNVDIVLLESLVQDEINEVKKSKGQKLLKANARLKNAAIDQNNYQIRLGDITHEQKNPSKRTLGDRVKAYGGGFQAMAENVLYQGFIVRTTGTKKEIITPTYQDHAKKMVKSWMESPGHRRNILNPTYDRVGTAIGYNGDLHAVFATQVFGKEF